MKNLSFILPLLLLLLLARPSLTLASNQAKDRRVENIVVFSKLYGCIKYFYPGIKQGELYWQQFAMAGISKVINAQTDEELVDSLRKAFQMIPEMQFTRDRKPVAVSPLVYSNKQKVIFWKHAGYKGLSANPDAAKMFSSNIVKKPLSKLPHYLTGKEIVTVPLGTSGWASFPIVLAAKGPNPISQNSPFPDKADSITRQVASLIICWNELLHFHPYISPLDLWTENLRGSLSVLFDGDGYQNALIRMVSQLGDAHGAIYERNTPIQSIAAIPPLTALWIENQLVVTAFDSSLDIRLGDAIIKIDGVDAGAYIDSVGQYILAVATPTARKRFASYYCLSGREGSFIKLDIRKPNGNEYSLTLKRTSSPPINFPVRKPSKGSVYELESNMFYINLCALTKADFEPMISKLAAAKGILLDLRCYPKEPYTALAVLRHFTGKELISTKRILPIYYGPRFLGYVPDTSTVNFTWSFSPKSPTFSCPMVCMTGSGAQSYAETIIGLIKKYNLGTIVGDNTAGTDGVVNFIELPNSYTVRYTALDVRWNDGSVFYGIGITPDVFSRTKIQNVIKQEDIVFLEALEILKMKL